MGNGVSCVKGHPPSGRRAAAFGLVWHIWWLVIAGATSAWGAVIVRSFARDVHRTIPAAEVERIESRWLCAVTETVPIPRQLETTSANRRLAKVSQPA